MELLKHKFETFLAQVKKLAPDIETGEIQEDGYLFPLAVTVNDHMIEMNPQGLVRVQLYAGNNTWIKSNVGLLPSEVASILNAFL